jgi:hypothetical protein
MFSTTQHGRKAFINASNLKGKTGKLLVYDMQGKVVHSEPLRIQNGYYTRDLSMAGYAEWNVFGYDSNRESTTDQEGDGGVIFLLFYEYRFL